MRVNASPFRVSLRWSEPITVADGSGACITSRRGTVWITQDNDIRDVVLSAGECFVLDQSDLTIVQAFDTAEVLIKPRRTALRATMAQRLRQSWRRSLERGRAQCLPSSQLEPIDGVPHDCTNKRIDQPVAIRGEPWNPAGALTTGSDRRPDTGSGRRSTPAHIAGSCSAA